MADTTSQRRSIGEVLLTSLGFSPSGSPSGTPMPTGAQSYFTAGSAQEHDGVSVVKYAKMGRELVGVTGPQPSGFGYYGQTPVQIDDKDEQTALQYGRQSRILLSGQTGSNQPSGTGLYPSTGSSPVTIDDKDEPSSASDTPPIQMGQPAFGAAGVTNYRLRARDAAGPLTDPARYVYWTSTTATLASYPGTFPFGGPLVELTILDTWVS